MAFREVGLPEGEQRSAGRKFKKFDAIGDRATGVFMGTETDTANYNDGPKQVTKFVFWNAKEGEFEVTAPTDLESRLKRAMKPASEGGLGLAPAAPGRNHLVRMTFTSTKDIGRASPMKVFKLEVDTEFQIPAGATPPARQQAQQAQRPAGQQRPPPPTDDDFFGPPPPGDDDVPF